MNDGAQAFELDPITGEPLQDEFGNPLPPVLESNKLCLAAIEDFNGDGHLAFDGTGDEDGDGLTDYVEACEQFSDPCDPGDPFLRVDLEALYTERHDLFDNGFRGFFDYYATPYVSYENIPFLVKTEGINNLSSTLSGMESFQIPAGGVATSAVWMVGVETFPASPVGYVHLYRIAADPTKDLDFILMKDNHPVGDYTVLAVTLER